MAVQIVTMRDVSIGVSNPVYTNTGIPVFGTPNTHTDTDIENV
jgi:hypothetical protein